MENVQKPSNYVYYHCIYYFTWEMNLVYKPKGETKVAGISGQSPKENIWA
jgi:hypothetical protein